jgi:hypothetical protein
MAQLPKAWITNEAWNIDLASSDLFTMLRKRLLAWLQPSANRRPDIVQHACAVPEGDVVDR